MNEMSVFCKERTNAEPLRVNERSKCALNIIMLQNALPHGMFLSISSASVMRHVPDYSRAVTLADAHTHTKE